MRQFALNHLRVKRAQRVLLSWRWLALLAIAVIAPLGLHGQLAGTGAISGTVTDTSNAVIPNATVTATAAATGIQTARTTTAAGDFTISPLAPGVYTVTVSAPGFEKFVQQNVTVDALK